MRLPSTAPVPKVPGWVSRRAGAIGSKACWSGRAKAFARPGAWPRERSFAGAWFEDDAQVDALLRERAGGPERWLQRLPLAATANTEQLFERKRAVWTERLLWMALWSRAGQTRPAVPWQDFLIVAMVHTRNRRSTRKSAGSYPAGSWLACELSQFLPAHPRVQRRFGHCPEDLLAALPCRRGGALKPNQCEMPPAPILDVEDIARLGSRKNNPFLRVRSCCAHWWDGPTTSNGCQMDREFTASAEQFP